MTGKREGERKEYAWELWRSLLRMAYIMHDDNLLCKLIEDGPEEKELLKKAA